jgi:hypothetical protein
MTAAARETQPSDALEFDAAAWRDRLEGSNINQTTLLATDYLNHFNEVVMLIEMIPDMPDCLEDVCAWQPKSYQQHFADSGLSESDLAIEAYDNAPRVIRDQMETLIGQANQLVAVSAKRIETSLEIGDESRLAVVAVRAARDLKRLVEFAGAIINGTTGAINQSEIDEMFAD